jgi:hypothetical protein
MKINKLLEAFWDEGKEGMCSVGTGKSELLPQNRICARFFLETAHKNEPTSGQSENPGTNWPDRTNFRGIRAHRFDFVAVTQERREESRTDSILRHSA